jgi:hypothetical protein
LSEDVVKSNNIDFLAHISEVNKSPYDGGYEALGDVEINVPDVPEEPVQKININKVKWN